ncbi:dentin sialophosphoprotein-like [Ornithodoros turicata]|uniref:dentin sialophosphoprotein-like n=1 Tax=Ornithodoros turicata TaxID=34597 RepID=UPI003139FB03
MKRTGKSLKTAAKDKDSRMGGCSTATSRITATDSGIGSASATDCSKCDSPDNVQQHGDVPNHRDGQRNRKRICDGLHSTATSRITATDSGIGSASATDCSKCDSPDNVQQHGDVPNHRDGQRIGSTSATDCSKCDSPDNVQQHGDVPNHRDGQRNRKHICDGLHSTATSRITATDSGIGSASATDCSKCDSPDNVQQHGDVPNHRDGQRNRTRICDGLHSTATSRITATDSGIGSASATDCSKCDSPDNVQQHGDVPYHRDGQRNRKRICDGLHSTATSRITATDSGIGSASATDCSKCDSPDNVQQHGDVPNHRDGQRNRKRICDGLHSTATSRITATDSGIGSASATDCSKCDSPDNVQQHGDVPNHRDGQRIGSTSATDCSKCDSPDNVQQHGDVPNHRDGQRNRKHICDGLHSTATSRITATDSGIGSASATDCSKCDSPDNVQQHGDVPNHRDGQRNRTRICDGLHSTATSRITATDSGIGSTSATDCSKCDSPDNVQQNGDVPNHRDGQRNRKHICDGLQYCHSPDNVQQNGDVPNHRDGQRNQKHSCDGLQ